MRILSLSMKFMEIRMLNRKMLYNLFSRLPQKFFLIFFPALIIFSAPVCLAQKRALRKGEKAFDRFQFDKAIKNFTKVLEKNPDNYKAVSELAAVYRLIGDYDNGVKWYAEVVKHPEATAIEKFHYAQMLRAAGRYDEAKSYYAAYDTLAPGDP